MIKKPGTEKVFNDSLSVWVKTNINKKLNSKYNIKLDNKKINAFQEIIFLIKNIAFMDLNAIIDII